jgi:ribosomal protein S18 acetylase RimI-like enzyme
MSDAELTLRPLTRAEFDEWLPRQVAGYAALIAASGAMPAQAAREKAELDTARYFGGGVATPGQLVFRIMAGQVGVGWLWLGVPGPDPDPLMAWVFEVEIESAFRGRGYGRAAMRLAENEARARGMTSLGLNVHGQNMVARSLYESLGYEVTALQMKKPVLPALDLPGRPEIRINFFLIEQAFDKRTGLRLGLPLSAWLSKSVRIEGSDHGSEDCPV